MAGTQKKKVRPKRASSAKRPRSGKRAKPAKAVLRDIGPWRRLVRWAWQGALGFVAVLLFLALIFGLLNPPITATMIGEWRRSGDYSYDWVAIEKVSPHLPRALVAAEDANFCLHWGFDMAAIRLALDQGGRRGASTISQQTVKNVYLWQGRSWIRKALEALMTPVVELVWTKRRIIEVYLNVAEFGEGVFGAEAAAQAYFGISASKLTLAQASRLASVLPNPKERSAAKPGAKLQRRAASIAQGAETILADGRSACFES